MKIWQRLLLIVVGVFAFTFGLGVKPNPVQAGEYCAPTEYTATVYTFNCARSEALTNGTISGSYNFWLPANTESAYISFAQISGQGTISWPGGSVSSNHIGNGAWFYSYQGFIGSTPTTQFSVSYNTTGRIGGYPGISISVTANLRPPLPPPPTAQIAANWTVGSTTIEYGQTVNLSWYSSGNISYCYSSNLGGYIVWDHSGYGMRPLDTTTYDFSCYGPGGWSPTSYVTVFVNKPPPTVQLRANGATGSTTIGYNQTVNLSWTSSGLITECYSDYFGSVGSYSAGSTAGPLTSTRHFGMWCRGPGGQSQTSFVTVNVNPPPPPTVELRANGALGATTINYGQSANLSWYANGLISWCSSTFGYVGSYVPAYPVGPLTAPTNSYYVYCYGPGGYSNVSYATVYVNAPPPGDFRVNPPATPICSATASRPTVTVSWNSSAHATSYTVYENNVPISTTASTSISRVVPNATTLNYVVWASNSVRSVLGTPAPVTVTTPDCAPKLEATLSPASATVVKGGTQVFTASATLNNQPITMSASGATTSTPCTVTDAFDSLSEGATLPSDYGTVVNPYTSIAISQAAGKSGKGIRMIDNNPDTAANNYGSYVGAGRSVRSTATGSVEMDVNITGTGSKSLTIGVGSSQGVFIYTYLMQGRFMYWSPYFGQYYQPISSQTWQENQWYRIKIAWAGDTFDYYVDGQKLNGFPLPNSYINNTNVYPVTSLGFSTTYDSTLQPTGTYLVDNVTYPGTCTQPVTALNVPVSVDWSVTNSAVGSIVKDPNNPLKATLTASSAAGSYPNVVKARITYTMADGISYSKDALASVTIADPKITGDIYSGGSVSNLNVDSKSVVSAADDNGIIGVTGTTLKIPGYKTSNSLQWDTAKTAIHDQAAKLLRERVDVAHTLGSVNGYTVSGPSFNLNPAGCTKTSCVTSGTTVNQATPEGAVWYVPGNLTIKGPVKFVGRGTLIVNGSVTIQDGDLSYADGNASLGIIADPNDAAVAAGRAGNITIAATTNNVVGAYFASKGTIALASSVDSPESLTVPSSGEIVSSTRSLKNGATYRIDVTGELIINIDNGVVGDAEYYYKLPAQPPVDIATTDCHGSGRPTADLGLQISPVDTAPKPLKQPRWGAFSPTHQYSTTITGTGSPVRFNYVDCQHDDNTGSLSVTITQLADGSSVSAMPFSALGLFVGNKIQLARLHASITYDPRVSTKTPPGFGVVSSPGIQETAP